MNERRTEVKSLRRKEKNGDPLVQCGNGSSEGRRKFDQDKREQKNRGGPPGYPPDAHLIGLKLFLEMLSLRPFEREAS